MNIYNRCGRGETKHPIFPCFSSIGAFSIVFCPFSLYRTKSYIQRSPPPNNCTTNVARYLWWVDLIKIIYNARDLERRSAHHNSREACVCISRAKSVRKFLCFTPLSLSKQSVWMWILYIAARKQSARIWRSLCAARDPMLIERYIYLDTEAIETI